MGGGPRSTAGKAVARMNRVGHGMRSVMPVIPTEDADEWEAHRAGIETALAPANALEAELMERVALLLWRLRRVVRFETAVIAMEQGSIESEAATAPDLSDPMAFLTAKGRTFDEELSANEAIIAAASRRLRVLSQWDDPGSEQTIAAEDAIALLDAVAESAGITLAYAHIWKLPPRDRWDTIAEWTVTMLHEYTERLAKFARVTLDSLLELTQEAEQERIYAAHTAKEQLEMRMERMRMRRLLPDSATLEKITRYESHLHRQLLNTLHELEALQTRRGGGRSPLARIDVQGAAPEE